MTTPINAKIIALSVAQSCYWFATLIGISLSAIVGLKLSPIAELATLPFALASLGGLLCTYALSMYMQRSGRRAGLRLGVVAGVVAALLSCVALQLASFWLFCFASLLLGCYQASSVYYRLAAMDEAAAPDKSTAMSWVLCGSLLAAIAGPSLAKLASGLQIGASYTGPYLMVALFALLAYAALGQLDKNKTPAAKEKPSSQAELPANVHYWAGVINTSFAQFIMMLMMVIAPLALHADGFAVSVSMSVIGWHIIGMFLPSFFSGKLIDRWGATKVLWLGYAIYALSALVALQGHSVALYYASLFLLGTGWNFVYMAGTSQYNQAISAHKQGKAQGLAELSIALAATIAVFAGGVMINQLSWSSINGYVLIMLLLIMLLNIALKFRAVRLAQPN